MVSVVTSWGHDHAAIIPVVAATPGVKAINAEKPLATSMAEANEIVRLVQANGIKLACAYLRRWNPRYHFLKRQIDEGAVGRLLSITAVGISNLMHAGTHYADIMAYLAGDPEPAFAWGRIEPIPPDAKSPTAKVDPLGSGYIELQNGVRLFLEGVSSGAISFVISGTEGKLIVMNDGRDADLWRTPAAGQSPAGSAGQSPAGSAGGRWLERQTLEMPEQTRSSVLLVLEDLVRCVQQGGEPACSERHATRAMELCLALHASHRRGGQRVEFPLQDLDLGVDTW